MIEMISVLHMTGTGGAFGAWMHWAAHICRGMFNLFYLVRWCSWEGWCGVLPSCALFLSAFICPRWCLLHDGLRCLNDV